VCVCVCVCVRVCVCVVCMCVCICVYENVANVTQTSDLKHALTQFLVLCNWGRTGLDE
jgi:hypothetical protein